MKVNINSAYFPLHTLRKHQKSALDDKISSLKVFREYKNSNNKDIPDYLKIPTLLDNPQTFKSKHIESPFLYESEVNKPSFGIKKIQDIDKMKANPSALKQQRKIDVPTFTDDFLIEKRNRIENYKPKQESYPNDYLAKVITEDLENRWNKLPFKIKPCLLNSQSHCINQLRNNNKETEKITVYNNRYSLEKEGNTNIQEYDENSNHSSDLRSKSIIGKGGFDFHPKRSVYLNNFNDYKISEADKYDESIIKKLPKKVIKEYNCVKDKMEEHHPGEYILPTYSKYEKKYLF